MAYTYCSCGFPLNKPSLEEDVTFSFECPKCEKIQPPIKSIEEWLIELSERIEILEENKTK